MSLIHWWPLNGDTKDYGTDNVALTNSGATVSDSGKIGKCYSFNSNAMTSSAIEIGDEFSVCYWVKYTSLTYPKTHVGIQHSAGAYTGANKGWDIGHGPSGGGTLNFDINDGTHIQRMSFTASNISELNVWKHFALVCSLSAKTVKLYINGVLVGTNNMNSSMTSFKTNRAIVIGGLYGWSLYGYLNDFRLYDHCLSQKEVKEISKGLVLHYTFEDPYIEATTNLITSITAGGQVTVSDGVVTTSGTNADTYFQLNMTESLTQGTVYTISCEASGFTGTEEWQWPIGGQDNSSLVFLINKNGYNSYTFTMNSYDAGTNRCFMDDIYCSARETGNQYKFWNWQIEKKDHATPYVNGTRSTGTVYDSSGYGYNGTVNGDLQVSDDSACGEYSLVYDSDYTHNVESSMNPNFLNNGMTLMMWVKNNRNFLLANGQDSNCYLMAMDTTHKWSNVTDGTITYYVDGVVNAGGRPTDGNWHLYTVVLTGGIPSWTKLYFNRHDNSWVINGKVADIKIYATALSASDILSEYQRKTAIDRDGNLFTGKLIEQEFSKNIIETARLGIATKTWNNCIGNYYQANSVCSMTDDGARIYRTPNHDGRPQQGSGWDNWGGIKFTPLLEDSNALQKGHTYLIKYHVKGKTCDEVYPGWTNNMGWGGGGLEPSPSNVSFSSIPAGFNGEKDCWHKFTINDDVYKICTSSYYSFVQGTVYPSYRDFTILCSYSITDENGTDLYITNPRMYDITGLTEQEIQVLKTGIVSCEDIYECPDTNARFEKSKTVSIKNLKEI